MTNDEKGAFVRFYWLLSGLLGVWLLASPVQAATLRFWRFDAAQNRLEFSTDDQVQPNAKLIFNPTRLVIDLPGVRLGNQLRNQLIRSPGIQQIRVGQFDAQTTRIVVELSPGYTLDPNQVQFRGLSPTQWTVQLPTPQRGDSSGSPAASTPLPPISSAPPSLPAGGAVLEALRVTQDGFLISTRGAAPSVQRIERSRDRQTVTLDLRGVTLSPGLAQRPLAINSRGINQIQLSQLQSSPPVTRVTLQVARNSPDWQAFISGTAGVVLLPVGGSAALPSGGQSWPAGRQLSGTANNPLPNQPATVLSVDLAANGSQLLIQTDGQVQASGGWDRATAGYKITLNNARLSNQARIARAGLGTPLSRLNVRQAGSNTVEVLLVPNAGVSFGAVSQPSSQFVSLQLSRGVLVPPLPSDNPISVPVPQPTPTPTPDLGRPLPNARFIVMVDPGHGGGDPGAVGIGGLQEKEVVLDISRQVAAFLQQSGVQAILTRNSDVEIDLEPRVQMAERANATLFVSIHANAISMSRPDISGLETYYFDSGDRLARTIHNSILESIPISDRGVRQARFYVLRRTSMPAVLVETGFVTGADDAAKLSDPTYRTQMAQAIARGVIQYLRQNY